MRMFNDSILCRQSIELFRYKLWFKLNSPQLRYLYTSYKIALIDKQPFAKMYFFLHDTSVLYMQYICIIYAK